MALTHEEAQELIPAYSASKLQGAALESLRAHLRDCEACAEMASGIGGVVATLLEGGQDLVDPHPDEQALIAYAAGVRGPAADRVERHIRHCATCSLEVSVMAPGGASAVIQGTPQKREKDFPLKLGIAASILAAGVLVGIIVTASWRRASMPAGSHGSPQASWSGPVELHILPQPIRGEKAVTRFTLHKGQPATILHLPRMIPRDGSPEEKFRLIVRHDPGAVVFDRIDTRSAMEQMIERWGVIPILLPASSLPAGRYEVAVATAEAPSEEVAAIPFEIVRED